MDENHYLRTVLAVGDKCQVHASTPIFSGNGVKLVDSGVRISSSLYSKLMAHRLAAPIEDCLSIENAVSRGELLDKLSGLARSERFARMGSGEALEKYIADAVQDLPFQPQMAFKLTLLRERLPETYAHSLEVALSALILYQLGPSDGVPGAASVLAAGLLHDIGLLHLDPKVLEGDGHFGEEYLKHIYSHPVLGYLALKHFDQLDAGVASAVLEHHERLDGSGYPKGVEGEQISPFGQLIAVAELVSSLLDTQGQVPFSEMLHVVFSLNRDKLNARLAKILVDVLATKSSVESGLERFESSYESVFNKLLFISTATQGWYELASHWPALPVAILIDRRVRTLEKRLAGLGIDLTYWRMMDAEVCRDNVVLGEIAIGATEACWQLREIVREARRKWSAMQPMNSHAQEQVWSWLKFVEDEGSALNSAH